MRRFVHLAGIDTTTGRARAVPGRAAARRCRACSPRASSRSRSCGRRSCSAVATPPSCRALARLVKLAPAVPVPGDGTRAHSRWSGSRTSCAASMQLADDMRPGQFPIGGPDQPTYDEVLDTIGEGLGKRHVRKLHLPVPVFSVQARAAVACCPARRSRPPRSSCSRATTRPRSTRSSSSSASARAASRSTCAARACSPRRRHRRATRISSKYSPARRLVRRLTWRSVRDSSCRPGALEDVAVEPEPVVDDDRERRARAQAAGAASRARPPCRRRRRAPRARRRRGCGCRSPPAGAAPGRAARRRRRAGRGSR